MIVSPHPSPSSPASLTPEASTLAALLADLPGAVVVVDAVSGIIAMVSAGITELSGYPAQTLIGQPLTALLPREDQPEVMAWFLAHVRQHHPPSRTARLWHREGRPAPVEMRLSPAVQAGSGAPGPEGNDRSGQTQLWSAVWFRNLAGMGAGDGPLQRLELRYRGLIATTSEGVAELDDEGRITNANDALGYLLGLSREDVLGQPLVNYVHAGYRELFQLQFAARLKDRFGLFDVVMVRPDGLERFVHIRSAALSDGISPHPMRLFLLSDYTELHRREIALAKSEARVRAVVESAVDGIVLLDPQERILSVNPAVLHLTGQRIPSLVGQNITSLIPEGVSLPQDGAPGPWSFPGRHSTECTLRRADGATLPAALAISEIRLPDYHVFVVMIRDITEAKAAERALIAAKEASDLANRAKSAFLANMSHELRTPLNAILGFADIIASAPEGSASSTPGRSIRAYAQEIKRSGELLLANITDILDMATIESGSVNLTLDLTDVRDVVVTCLRLVGRRLEQGHLTVRAELASELPPVEADPNGLKQILLHILSNAIKFTPPHGEITVAARVGPEGDLAITVTDTGIGIPADRLTNVVQPFVMADASLTRRHEGIGLGLSISKSLVEMHGGRLEITSTQGVGTTVTIRLPPERLVGDW